ncbi:hypothetical protein LCGC14_2493610 [marine sediment metagenome]|uniref:Uncharacterized protein n=1 Tax=marine sediment metagenome TaxID=412755 RepID=A0A0F9DFT6_9ZZZZ
MNNEYNTELIKGKYMDASAVPIQHIFQEYAWWGDAVATPPGCAYEIKLIAGGTDIDNLSSAVRTKIKKHSLSGHLRVARRRDRLFIINAASVE